MAITKIDDRGLNTPIDLLDDEKIRFGTGNDIEIYHSSGQSYITNSTGNFRIDADNLRLRSKTGNEAFISASLNGSVELYYNDTRKLYTDNGGVVVEGNLYLSAADDYKAIFGAGQDLQIYHSSSDNNSYIQHTQNGTSLIVKADYFIVAENQSTDFVMRAAAGTAELYYDNSKKLQTTSAGTLTSGIIQAKANSGNAAQTLLKLTNTDATSSGETGQTADIEFEFTDNPGNSYKAAKIGAYKAADWHGNPDYDAGLKFFTVNNSASFENAYTERLKITEDGEVSIPDNGKFTAGTGNDLKIYHDGTKSVIVNYTGDFHLRTNDGGGSSEEGIIIKPNADVEIYYNDSKKLETASGGVRIFDNLLLDGDSRYIKLGASDDLQIYHDGTNSLVKNTTGQLCLNSDEFGVANAAFTENIIRGSAEGDVKLFYDNSEKLTTTSGGIDVTGTATTDGLQITGASYFNADAVFDGATAGRDCWWDRSDNSFKFYDNAYLKIGNDTDLQLYHDGSNSYIHHDGAGDFTVKAPGSGENVWIQAGAGVYLNSAVNESGVDVVQNSSVKLYYDNSKKFETDSYGAMVYGNLVVGTNAGELLFTNPDGHSPKFKESAGGIECYTDNTKRWTIESNGNTVYEDDVKIFFGSGNDFRFWHDGSDNHIWGTGAHDLIFAANNAEKMRLYDTGEFRVHGGGSDVANRHFRFSVHATSPLLEINHTAQNSNHTLIYFKAAGSAIGEIKQDGDGTITYADSSDYRLKENIVDISDGITRLKQLKPRRFNFKSKPGYTKDGFIAHELQTVVPESVNGAKDEVVTADSKANIPQLEDKEIGDPVYQTVDKSRIIPLLTAALQEAVSKIETLEAKVAALESS